MDDYIFLNFILSLSLYTPKKVLNLLLKLQTVCFMIIFAWKKKKANLNELPVVFFMVSWHISLFHYLVLFIKISLTMLFRLHLTARLSHIQYPLWAQEWNEPFNWALITWLLHSLLMICTLKGESKYRKRNSNDRKASHIHISNVPKSLMLAIPPATFYNISGNNTF